MSPYLKSRMRSVLTLMPPRMMLDYSEEGLSLLSACYICVRSVLVSKSCLVN